MQEPVKTCQAIVEDRDHPLYNAPRQRIFVPGAKPCSRSAKETVGHLSLCTTHARMAREGLVAWDGAVAPKEDIANVRRNPEKFPHGLYHWAIGKAPGSPTDICG